MRDRRAGVWILVAGLIVVGLLGAGELAALLWLPYPPPFVIRVAQRYGLEPRLVGAIIWHESRYTPDLITHRPGRAPDIGLMQVNLATVHAMSTPRWQTITVSELLDPETNVECGCLILRWYLFEALQAEGMAVRDVRDVPSVLARATPAAWLAVYGRALAGYNGGTLALRAWPDVSPQTREYVDTVLALYRCP